MTLTLKFLQEKLKSVTEENPILELDDFFVSPKEYEDCCKALFTCPHLKLIEDSGKTTKDSYFEKKLDLPTLNKAIQALNQPIEEKKYRDLFLCQDEMSKAHAEKVYDLLQAHPPLREFNYETVSNTLENMFEVSLPETLALNRETSFQNWIDAQERQIQLDYKFDVRPHNKKEFHLDNADENALLTLLDERTPHQKITIAFRDRSLFNDQEKLLGLINFLSQHPTNDITLQWKRKNETPYFLKKGEEYSEEKTLHLHIGKRYPDLLKHLSHHGDTFSKYIVPIRLPPEKTRLFDVPMEKTVTYTSKIKPHIRDPFRVHVTRLRNNQHQFTLEAFLRTHNEEEVHAAENQMKQFLAFLFKESPCHIVYLKKGNSYTAKIYENPLNTLLRQNIPEAHIEARIIQELEYPHSRYNARWKRLEIHYLTPGQSLDDDEKMFDWVMHLAHQSPHLDNVSYSVIERSQEDGKKISQRYSLPPEHPIAQVIERRKKRGDLHKWRDTFICFYFYHQTPDTKFQFLQSNLKKLKDFQIFASPIEAHPVCRHEQRNNFVIFFEILNRLKNQCISFFKDNSVREDQKKALMALWFHTLYEAEIYHYSCYFDDPTLLGNPQVLPPEKNKRELNALGHLSCLSYHANQCFDPILFLPAWLNLLVNQLNTPNFPSVSELLQLLPYENPPFLVSFFSEEEGSTSHLGIVITDENISDDLLRCLFLQGFGNSQQYIRRIETIHSTNHQALLAPLQRIHTLIQNSERPANTRPLTYNVSPGVPNPYTPLKAALSDDSSLNWNLRYTIEDTEGNQHTHVGPLQDELPTLKPSFLDSPNEPSVFTSLLSEETILFLKNQLAAYPSNKASQNTSSMCLQNILNQLVTQTCPSSPADAWKTFNTKQHNKLLKILIHDNTLSHFKSATLEEQAAFAKLVFCQVFKMAGRAHRITTVDPLQTLSHKLLGEALQGPECENKSWKLFSSTAWSEYRTRDVKEVDSLDDILDALTDFLRTPVAKTKCAMPQGHTYMRESCCFWKKKEPASAYQNSFYTLLSNCHSKLLETFKPTLVDDKRYNTDRRWYSFT